jgi:Fur family ferric uptake transcriptional regulator
MKKPSYKNRRITQQSLSIKQVVLDSLKPLNSYEIHNIFKDKKQKIGIATIYRTIQRLQEEEIIDSINFQGETTSYYQNKQHNQHNHFLCADCKQVFCLESKPSLKDLVPDGFQWKPQSLTFNGLCVGCATT